MFQEAAPKCLNLPPTLSGAAAFNPNQSQIKCSFVVKLNWSAGRGKNVVLQITPPRPVGYLLINFHNQLHLQLCGLFFRGEELLTDLSSLINGCTVLKVGALSLGLVRYFPPLEPEEANLRPPIGSFVCLLDDLKIFFLFFCQTTVKVCLTLNFGF
jgi:hypothetical protein